MQIKKIGFDLDGVILDNTTFKKENYKKEYNLDFENWQLSANIIDEFVPDREMRRKIGTLASTRNFTKLLDKDCIELLNELSNKNYELYIVSRRGLSDNGQKAAWESINELELGKYFNEIIFCENEKDKIETIMSKGIDIFFDDRMGVIEGISGKISIPVLFDNFDLIARGMMKVNGDFKVIKNFKEIGDFIKENECFDEVC